MTAHAQERPTGAEADSDGLSRIALVAAALTTIAILITAVIAGTSAAG